MSAIANDHLFMNERFPAVAGDWLGLDARDPGSEGGWLGYDPAIGAQGKVPATRLGS
jgi:hypothetical protein